MGFEIVKKGSGIKATIPADCISIRKNGITFGEQASAYLFSNPDNKYLEIYLDYNSRKIGFKPTTNELTGFKVQNAGKGKHYLSNTTVLRQVTPGYHKIYIEDGLVIAVVPEIVRINQ